MVAELRSSDPMDPLSAYSGLALFPRTFGVAPDPSKPYDPDTDLDAIHNYLKSLALQCPNKFLEEAKMVLDGSSELANYPAIKEKNVGAVEDKESLQARRPALGRKRARFFLKSNLIQPTESLEPSLDIEQLKDPEEFFLAYERLENAKRELQKQIGGVSMDLDEHNPSKTARQRRPGILGRSVRYKHRYSSVISENNENILSSQETFDSGIVSPTNDISQRKTNHDLASKERYIAGSTDNPENKVSEILDELLSGNFEDLEGDRAVSILQKRLQIKPIDLEKLNLPELRDIQKIDLKSSRRNMLRPRKALADIDNMLKGISSKSHVKLIPEAESSFHHISSPTPPSSLSASLSVLQRQILSSKSSSDPFPNPDFGHSPAKNFSSTKCTLKESDLDHTGMQLSTCDELKSPLVEEDNIDNLLKGISSKTLVKLIQEAKSPFHHIASPTPPRSPLASLSLLQRQILQSKPSNDPFSIPDFGHSPAKNSSPIECMPKESDLDHTGMQLSNCNELKSPLVGEDDTATAETDSQDVAIEDVTCTSEAIVHDNSSKLSFRVDVGSSGTHVDMEDNVGGSMDIEVIDEQLSRHDADIDAQENGSNKLEDKVEDMPQEQVEAVASPECSVNMVDTTEENSNYIRTPLDQSNPAVVEDHAVHGLSQSPDNVPEQSIEKIQESIEVSLNEQINAKSRLHRERKSKERSHRKSLAGAGLLWKSGVRRSTRIRTRPLEYWKGERLLYGRIHQSKYSLVWTFLDKGFTVL
ncbi:centromere protein C-like [Corylus avellana]|uniref:centromere protein C-like n=1 Tax=Corylus avellana TaxID=13451 RepID=UPI00286BE5D1|nr:centromere protein C-like [Corylus avellana]